MITLRLALLLWVGFATQTLAGDQQPSEHVRRSSKNPWARADSQELVGIRNVAGSKRLRILPKPPRANVTLTSGQKAESVSHEPGLIVVPVSAGTDGKWVSVQTATHSQVVDDNGWQAASKNPAPTALPKSPTSVDVPKFEYDEMDVDRLLEDEPSIAPRSNLRSIFTPLNQLVAHDPREDQMDRSVDEASALLSGHLGQRHLYTQVHGRPMPNRHVHPFCHNPLYFEDLNLERCGHTYGCCTTTVSAAHFAVTAVMLPYFMAIDPPCTCHKAHQDCPTCQSYRPHENHPR